MNGNNLLLCAETILNRCPDPYAKAYADVLMDMLLYGDQVEGDVYTQVLYVRSNLSTWRGDEAKRVRAELDLYIKNYGVEP